MLTLELKLSNTFSKKKTQKKQNLFCSLKSSGIFQHQTELIALNHYHSLKFSGHSDVITGIAEVAWESFKILGLTSPCIQSVSSITPFARFRQHWDWLGRALWAWDVVFRVLMWCRVCLCVCLWIQSKARLKGSDGRKWGGRLGGMKGWGGIGGQRGDEVLGLGISLLSLSVCLTRLSRLKAPPLTPSCFPKTPVVALTVTLQVASFISLLFMLAFIFVTKTLPEITRALQSLSVAREMFTFRHATLSRFDQ